MGKFGVVRKETTEFSVEELKAKFPSKKNTITEETAALINAANMDENFNGDEFMKTMIEYQSVMIDCSGSINEYINALKFCAYLESEEGIVEAYTKARSGDAFVQERLGAKSGTPEYNALSAAASRFRKSPMVRQILTQSDMPLYLMFQGGRYQAVAVLMREMESAAYSKDRIAAAKALLDSVKAPENMQVELKVGPNKEAVDMSTQLSRQLAESVAMQKKLLEAGVDIREATKLGIKIKTQEELEIEEAELLDE